MMKMSNLENPTWQTAAIFDNHYISISQPQIVGISRNLVDTEFNPGDGNVTKNLKFPNSRWRTTPY